MCPSTLVGVSSSCRNCTSMLHADGCRCYATIELGTRDKDRDSFGMVGFRCREPRITAPWLKQSRDKLRLLTHQVKQSDGASKQGHGASICCKRSSRGCHSCIVKPLQLPTVKALLPFLSMFSNRNTRIVCPIPCS